LRTKRNKNCDTLLKIEGRIMDKFNAKEIAAALEKGAVVILPTGTVYGLLCSALNKKGAAEIYRIKGRNENKPLQVFLPDRSMISEYAAVSPEQKSRIDGFLPGAFTVILNLRPEHKNTFSFLKNGTAGFRVIDSPLFSGIMKELGGPLAATSANISGMETPKKFADIDKNIIKAVFYAFEDDGQVKGKASTVIDLTAKVMKVIRK
jgi:tRNA threonylcarbamoyl adenosine modification protein (Sua5/YciO/YrdC/YwlC family)